MTGILATPIDWTDDYVVQGTEDVDKARRAVILDVIVERGYTHEEAEGYAKSLKSAVAWLRWNPCDERSCYDGGGHRGHLGIAKGPGHGNWRGVYFRGPC